jgi:2-desacetyl-2-hydroxyethyl bacteriochlorophyllide A dehydrogenase
MVIYIASKTFLYCYCYFSSHVNISSAICGSDIHYWNLGAGVGLVMGHEVAGTVVDPGSRDDLKVGDRITTVPYETCGTCPQCLSGNSQRCVNIMGKALGLSAAYPGGYAQYLHTSPKMVMKLPDQVSFEAGAMIKPTSVALHAVNLTNIRMGDHVLIVDASIIGCLCATFAKMRGASYVAISEANKLRGEKAVTLNAADEFFDALDENFTKNVNKDNPYGYDVVIDCYGNGATLTSAINAVKNGGTVVMVGVSLKPESLPTGRIVAKEICLKGSFSYKPEKFAKVLDLMAKGLIDVTKFIDDTISLDEVEDAFLRLTSGKESTIKIEIAPNK